MCMHTVSTIHTHPKKVFSIGLKRFYHDQEKNLYAGEYFGFIEMAPGVWWKAQPFLIRSDDNRLYNSGFHIWVNLTKAEKAYLKKEYSPSKIMVLREVVYTDLIAVGQGWKPRLESEVEVAQSMYIPTDDQLKMSQEELIQVARSAYKKSPPKKPPLKTPQEVSP